MVAFSIWYCIFQQMGKFVGVELQNYLWLIYKCVCMV